MSKGKEVVNFEETRGRMKLSGKGEVPSGAVGPGIKSDRYVLIDGRREHRVVVS